MNTNQLHFQHCWWHINIKAEAYNCCVHTLFLTYMCIWINIISLFLYCMFLQCKSLVEQGKEGQDWGTDQGANNSGWGTTARARSRCRNLCGSQCCTHGGSNNENSTGNLPHVHGDSESFWKMERPAWFVRKKLFIFCVLVQVWGRMRGWLGFYSAGVGAI